MARGFNAEVSIRHVFAQACREGRIELDLTQQQLADALGLHRGHVANIESGRTNLSIDLMDRIAAALGQRLELTVHAPAFVGERRRHDLVHAWCSGYVGRRLQANGWLVAREVDVIDGGVRGWIDLLAYEPDTAILRIVEIKTRLEDVGALERQIGWYERHARTGAARRGWRARSVATWLLLLASEEVDRALFSHRELMNDAFPGRPGGRPGSIGDRDRVGSRFLALIDPASRRRNWLIRPRIDGRRSALPYRDYADAARRIPERRR